MNKPAATAGSPSKELLAKVSRYEALFELTDLVNAAADIESVSQLLAGRIKYIADVYSWRYVCVDGDPQEVDGSDLAGVVVDAVRGQAVVNRAKPLVLSNLEAELWDARKTRILAGEQMRRALGQLPDRFQRDDIEQISVNTLVDRGRTEALYLFCRRRQPFTDLDAKCLSMVCGFFHRKVHMLWEQQKLRDLEMAYLQQEVMLRESEKLATLGRLSAGMAHELNNPATAAGRAAGQLKSFLERLEDAHEALGAANLSNGLRQRVAELEGSTSGLAGSSLPPDPMDLGQLEEEVEDWLERRGIADAWEHAPPLVEMGLGPSDLDHLGEGLDSSVVAIVIEYLSSRFAARSLLADVGNGASRVTEIVNALKSYAYLDQAPVQWLDVRVGLEDTLVLLASKLGEGIEVRSDYAPDMPRIHGHGTELNQVWTNLVDNAIVAMGGEGVLEIRAYTEGAAAVVEVADSGRGIPAEEIGKIFDPFYTTKAPGEGTGLGLTISHSIVVEKHGGTISATSRPGATRFTVKLPVDARASLDGEVLTAPSGSTGSGTEQDHEA